MRWKRTIFFEFILTVDGQIIESTAGLKPQKYIPGDGTIMGNLAKVLERMKEGEEKRVTFEPEDAYGKHYPEAYRTFSISELPQGQDLSKGMIVNIEIKDGESIKAVVWQIKGDDVLFNFNHPLAGKTLTYDLKIVKIKKTWQW